MKGKLLKEKSSVEVLGFWHHIIWENKDKGVDQYGQEWLNQKKPVRKSSTGLNIIFDNYNKLIK